MCGIFGVIGKKIDFELANRCIDSMAHRGPDGRGLWQEDVITLGHRRLSILDLSANGAQPMIYADRYVITYNGEIYNYIEVRNELKKLGFTFNTETDTEVILAAYMKWGEKCLSKFNGMFAFCIYDRYERISFIARDRFGVKPLFYTELSHGQFAFASEMKAIIPLMHNPKINAEIIKDTSFDSINTIETAEYSLIHGIKKIKAGQYAIIREGYLHIYTWWDTISNLVDVPTNYDDQVDEFRRLFIDACKLRMRSDVQIGTALSGGLDSSCVLAAMTQAVKNGDKDYKNINFQHAYIASFPGTAFDEKKYAQMVTQHLGIQETVINIDPVKLWDKIGNSLYLFEEVYHTTPIPMMEIYGAERKDGTIVTLDGHGADELFGGYGFDVYKALFNKNISLKEMINIIDTYQGLFENNDAAKAPDSNINIIYHVLGHKIKRFIKGCPDYKSLDCLHEDTNEWRELSYFDKVLYKESFNDVLPTLLRNYDRYSMANSVEIRMPFMDYRIVEFAFSISYTSKIRNGYTKAVIRDAMAPYLPSKVVYRKTKMGFNTPILEWVHGPLKDWFLDVTSSVDFLNCDIIDAKSIRSKVERITSSDYKIDYSGDDSAIWREISPFLWEKYFWKKVISN